MRWASQAYGSWGRGGGGGAGLERLRDGRVHAHYDKCVGEPRGATCGVLLAACRFTCVSSGSRSFSVVQQPPPRNGGRRTHGCPAPVPGSRPDGEGTGPSARPDREPRRPA